MMRGMPAYRLGCLGTAVVPHTDLDESMMRIDWFRELPCRLATRISGFAGRERKSMMNFDLSLHCWLLCFPL